MVTLVMLCDARQLGYSQGQPTLESYFGEVSPPVFSMDEVACTGAEESLQQCGYNNHDDCDKDEAAGGWRQLNPSARIFKSSIREILRG